MEKLKIFSGNSNPELAEKIAKSLNQKLGNIEISRFADGEVQIEIKESIRGDHVFFIQSCCPPFVNNYYMELFIALDALKRASCSQITAVIPYYGYARQDRKVAPRAPISAKAISNLLKISGAQRILSLDLHSNQIQGFFDGPVDHLFASSCFIDQWVQSKGSEDFVVISPDSGGVERARYYGKKLKCPIGIIDKRRLKPNQSESFNLIGDVAGKKAIIVDDMIDTAGTLTKGVPKIIEKGAKEVYALATHPVFSASAVEKIEKSELKEVWVTDSIPLSKEAKACSKIKVVSVAELMGKAISRIHSFQSVSEMFE